VVGETMADNYVTHTRCIPIESGDEKIMNTLYEHMGTVYYKTQCSSNVFDVCGENTTSKLANVVSLKSLLLCIHPVCSESIIVSIPINEDKTERWIRESYVGNPTMYILSFMDIVNVPIPDSTGLLNCAIEFTYFIHLNSGYISSGSGIAVNRDIWEHAEHISIIGFEPELYYAS
jgi:hypothetical protein